MTVLLRAAAAIGALLIFAAVGTVVFLASVMIKIIALGMAGVFGLAILFDAYRHRDK